MVRDLDTSREDGAETAFGKQKVKLPHKEEFCNVNRRKPITKSEGVKVVIGLTLLICLRTNM